MLALHQFTQPRQRGASRLGGKLCFVATAELRKSDRLMAIPLAQFGARRDILEPEINVRTRFGEAARPETLDQHTQPIARLRRLIDAL